MDSARSVSGNLPVSTAHTSLESSEASEIQPSGRCGVLPRPSSADLRVFSFVRKATMPSCGRADQTRADNLVGAVRRRQVT